MGRLCLTSSSAVGWRLTRRAGRSPACRCRTAAGSGGPASRRPRSIAAPSPATSVSARQLQRVGQDELEDAVDQAGAGHVGEVEADGDDAAGGVLVAERPHHALDPAAGDEQAHELGVLLQQVERALVGVAARPRGWSAARAAGNPGRARGSRSGSPSRSAPGSGSGGCRRRCRRGRGACTGARPPRRRCGRPSSCPARHSPPAPARSGRRSARTPARRGRVELLDRLRHPRMVGARPRRPRRRPCRALASRSATASGVSSVQEVDPGPAADRRRTPGSPRRAPRRAGA